MALSDDLVCYRKHTRGKGLLAELAERPRCLIIISVV